MLTFIKVSCYIIVCVNFATCLQIGFQNGCGDLPPQLLHMWSCQTFSISNAGLVSTASPSILKRKNPALVALGPFF